MSVLLSPRERRPVLPWLALGIYLIYLFTSSGGFESGDASLRYATARSWLAGQGGVLPRELGWDGGAFLPDGRVYSFFGPLQSVLMVPFLLLARALPGLPAQADVVETFVICLGLFPLLSTGVIALVYATLRLLGHGARAALLASLGLGLGSLFWYYARSGQEESLVALGFALWLYGAARLLAVRRFPATWMAAGAAVALATRWATVPQLAVLCAVTLLLLARHRDRVALEDLALGTGLVTVTAALLLAYNHARFGDWLETGYGIWYAHEGYSMFHLDGYGERLAALLVSPYRGLLVYSPVVLAAAAGLAALRGSQRTLGFGALATLAAALLFFAAFRNWTGGHSWGPRFLTSPQILLAPALAAFFAWKPRWAWLVPALAALQVFATVLPASTEEYVKFGIEQARSGGCSPWRFACTPVPQRIPRGLEAAANTWDESPGVVLAGRSPVAPDRVLATSDYRTVAWWPVRIAFRLGLFSARAALLACLLGLAAAAACLARAWRLTREEPS